MSTRCRYESSVDRILYDSDDGCVFDQLGDDSYGSYSSIYKVSDRSGKTRALKVFDQLGDDQAKERRKTETDALRKLKGADGHAPKFYSEGTFISENSDSDLCKFPAFETELIPGDTLEDVIKGRKLTGGDSLLDGKQALEVMEKVCDAVAACHSPTSGGGSVHRNLAPKNIMVDITNDASVSHAVIVGWEQVPRDNPHYTSTTNGMLAYAAPELLCAGNTEKGGREEALEFDLLTADVWSLGAIAYFVRTGDDPSLPAFSSLCEEERHRKWADHKDNNPISLPSCNDSYDKLLNDFIRRCTRNNHRERFQNAGEAREYLNARKQSNQSSAVESFLRSALAPDSTETASSNSSLKQKHASKRKIRKRVVAVLAVVIAVVVIANALGLLDMFGTEEAGLNLKTGIEDYSWAELAVISDEIAEAEDEEAALEVARRYNLVGEDGKLDGTQTKSVTLADGIETSVQIVGFAHDDKSDGSGKAGITFIFTDAIALYAMSSSGTNYGGWEASEVRSWLTGEGMALLPEDLQDVIVAVDKYTNNVGQTNDVSSVTATSDKLWLFSFTELVGNVSDTFVYSTVYNGEGSQYKLFADQQVDQLSPNGLLAKAYAGAETLWEKILLSGGRNWWMRSPSNAYTNYFDVVNDDGNPSYMGPAADLGLIVPGFCISNSTSALTSEEASEI